MWPDLVEGRLIRRYKRFLADVRLRNGPVVTAHCPNSGSMLTCAEPGRRVYLSRHQAPHRRTRYTWEMIEMPGSLVGVNTQVPNALVAAAVRAGEIRELQGYATVRREVRSGANSRIDLLLQSGEARCYIEIKNCTLVLDDGVACFPDAVTSRGLKHLLELKGLIRKGHRGVMFYLVQRMDARRFRSADEIDPDYGRGLREAIRAGVEALAYDVSIDLSGIGLRRRLPVSL